MATDFLKSIYTNTTVFIKWTFSWLLNIHTGSDTENVLLYSTTHLNKYQIRCSSKQLIMYNLLIEIVNLEQNAIKETIASVF